AVTVDRRDGRLRTDVDVAVAVVVVQRRRQLRREEACADTRLREDDRHPAVVERARGGDLGADEAAADNTDATAATGECPQTAIVVEGAEVDCLVTAEGQSPRPPAGRQQQPLVAVAL